MRTKKIDDDGDFLIKCKAVKKNGVPCMSKVKVGTDYCEIHLRFNDLPNKCTGINRKTGLPCKQASIKGGIVCRAHGARLPVVQKAAKKNIVLHDTRSSMMKYGAPSENRDPNENLLNEIARTAGHVEWLHSAVQGLDPEELIWTKTFEESSTGHDPKGNYDITRHEAVPHIWMDLYRWERKHLSDLCKIAIGAGIAERQIKLAEQQGHLIHRVVLAGLQAAGLAGDALEVAKQAAAAELRVINGGIAS